MSGWAWQPSLRLVGFGSPPCGGPRRCAGYDSVVAWFSRLGLARLLVVLLLVFFLLLEQRIDVDVLDALQRLDGRERRVAPVDLVQTALAVGVAIEHVRIIDAF